MSILLGALGGVLIGFSIGTVLTVTHRNPAVIYGEGPVPERAPAPARDVVTRTEFGRVYDEWWAYFKVHRDSPEAFKIDLERRLFDPDKTAANE